MKTNEIKKKVCYLAVQTEAGDMEFITAPILNVGEAYAIAVSNSEASFPFDFNGIHDGYGSTSFTEKMREYSVKQFAYSSDLEELSEILFTIPRTVLFADEMGISTILKEDEEITNLPKDTAKFFIVVSDKIISNRVISEVIGEKGKAKVDWVRIYKNIDFMKEFVVEEEQI